MDLESAISKLGGDLDKLRDDYLKVSSTLARFGLSEYEARAYIALVALGPSSASYVAKIGQIPRTSAYKTMEALEAKGFARSKEGRPRSFAPVDPSEVEQRLVSDLKETFDKVRTVKDIMSERGVPQLVYTIMGRDRVLEKIGEMVDKSEGSFVISSPSFAEIRKRLGKRFGSAASRGVKVTVITSPFVKVPRAFTAVRRKALIATDVISDGRMALLAAADLSACGYTDNAALSAHLEEFLRIMSQSGD